MNTLVAELYIVAVLSAGVCIGAWLHARLKKSDQITVKLPSAYKERKAARWAEEDEIFA
jgi:hypothetical protein